MPFTSQRQSKRKRRPQCRQCRIHWLADNNLECGLCTSCQEDNAGDNCEPPSSRKRRVAEEQDGDSASNFTPAVLRNTRQAAQRVSTNEDSSINNVAEADPNYVECFNCKRGGNSQSMVEASLATEFLEKYENIVINWVSASEIKNRQK